MLNFRNVIEYRTRSLQNPKNNRLISILRGLLAHYAFSVMHYAFPVMHYALRVMRYVYYALCVFHYSLCIMHYAFYTWPVFMQIEN